MTRHAAAHSTSVGVSTSHRHRHNHQSSAGTSNSLLLWHDFLLRDAAEPHTSDALIRSHDGPLRWLLGKRPPPRVVRSVLDAHRAVVFSVAARAANRRGETALHQACALGCPTEIIQMILGEDHSAVQKRTSPDGETPLHIVRDDEESTAALLLAHPRGVAAKDRFGGTPLHSAALCDSGPGPTRLLLEAGRDAEAFGPGGGALEENYRGMTPLGLACGYFTSFGCGNGEELGEESLRRWGKMEALAEMALEGLEDDASGPNSSDILNRSEVSDDMDGPDGPVEVRPFYILHSLLELGCPTPVVLRAIRMFPDQISRRDAWGRLPLHLACGGGRRRTRQHLNPGEKRDKTRGSSSSAPQVASPAVIRALLDSENEYPPAAAAADSKGRLPLQILTIRGSRRAVRNGGISMTKGFLDEEDKSASVGSGALSLVFRAAPRAIEMRDVATGMHLFMLAAVTSEGGETAEEDEYDDSRLNLVYCLLRKAPSVLRFSLSDTTVFRVEKRKAKGVESM